MIYIAENSDGQVVGRWIKVESVNGKSGSDFVIPVTKGDWVVMNFKNGFCSAFQAMENMDINRSLERLEKPNTKAAQLLD